MTAERYSFVRRIGSGASGPVWLGRDTTLGRDVALKRVGLAPGEESVDLARARREARLAASLAHPHVVGVLDLLERPDGHWLVMEYVAGRSLADLVRTDGPLPPERAARLMAPVAEALGAAHAAGIVHRDVKPTNVLVDDDDDAMLTDFGIARSYDDTVLTRAGLVTGSPAYMAPEVARGLPATPASDMWSFGATLHQVLTGHAPYEGDDVLAVMHRIVTEAPVRTARAGRLAPVLEHTMAVDPDARWDALRVARALRTAPASGGVQDPTDTQVLPPTEPGEDKERAAWPWVAVAAIVAAASLLAFWAGLHNGGSDPDEATRPARAPAASPEETRSPSDPATPPESTGPAPSPSAGEGEQAPDEVEDVDDEALSDFASGYLATVTRDPATTWTWLTPQFQSASGGYSAYTGFWSTVASARPDRIQASAESMTVTYDVTYSMRDGRTLTERVTLRLRQEDGTLRVAGES